MSWHFSRALVAEYSEVSSLDGGQSAQLKSKTTPAEFYYSGKMTASFQPSRYGTTSQHLTDDHGEALLTWFRAGFPVKTSHALEKGRESKDLDLDYGGKWQELSVRFDPNTSSWKTHRCLFQEDLQELSVTLPRWGMMLDGVCWEQMTLELPIKENESGYLATPTATANQLCPSMMKHPGCRKMMPTPVKYDATLGGPNNHYNGLGHMAKMNTWPTPRAQMYKNPPQNRLGVDSEEYHSNIEEAVGGQLNLTWVEWLMGWPIEWTDLKPLATDKFQGWLQQHGEF